jgi:hypothetical protein
VCECVVTNLLLNTIMRSSPAYSRKRKFAYERTRCKKHVDSSTPDVNRREVVCVHGAR